MKQLLATFCLFMVFGTHAQFDIDTDKIIDDLIGPIQSDRPGQCMNANTAGLAAIQIQTGFQYNRNPDQIANSYTSGTLVPTQLKFGFTKKWEFNINFSHNSFQSVWNNNPLWEVSGFGRPEFSVRYAFLQGDGIVPSLTAQVGTSTPKHNGDYQQQQWGLSTWLITSNDFDLMTLNTNFGMTLPGNGLGRLAFPYVVNFGFPLGDSFGAFIEGFGQFGTDNYIFTLSADAGFSYMPINSLQLDLFGGAYNLYIPGVASDLITWFAEIGVSYNFSFAKFFAKKKINEMKGNIFGN